MTLKPSSLGNTTQNYIGKSQWNDPYLNGSVDDFRIYARALSGAEIAALASFAPSQPTGLTASAGNGKATLLWSAAGGAASYNVKRSTTSGSGYATVANVPTPQFADSGLANGTTYYYVVSATNVVGESANSAQVSVTPNAGAATALLWSGAVNGTWDTATANWLNSGGVAMFANGNTAIFGDSGANPSRLVRSSNSQARRIRARMNQFNGVSPVTFRNNSKKLDGDNPTMALSVEVVMGWSRCALM